MSKYNLVAESQRIDFIGNNFTIQIPVNLPTGVLSVSLRDKQSRILKRAFFPVRLTKRSQLPLNADGKGNFRTPLTSRAGMPAIINGPFDGNFQNSFISISGQPVTLLTESTRQLVFLIPDGVQGQKMLSLREGTTEFKTPFTVLYVVKVGHDDPALVSRKDGANKVSPMGDPKGALIESEEQMGEINLEYNPDLGKTSQEKNSPVPMRRELAATEEPTMGPSINDLSKPLELDPKYLEKYSAPTQDKSYSENELTSLKQISDKGADIPVVENKPIEKTTDPAKPVVSTDKSGHYDIKDVKPLLDKQFNSPFTPLDTEDSIKADENLSPQNTQEIKKTSEKSIKPVKPIASKEEVKPVIAENSVTTKPPAPEVATANTDNNIQDPKLSSKVVKQEAVRNASDYSSKMDVKGIKPNAVLKKQELSKTDTKPVPSSTESGGQYRKLNDLSSLNSNYGSYQSLDKNKQITADEKSEGKDDEQIKEEKYVSLQKKGTVKPEIKTPIIKGKFAIQLASFKNESEASELAGKLNAGGYDVYFKRYNVPGKGYWYRVRKGGFSSRKEAEAYKNGLNLTKYHINSFFVTPED
jgi:cell division septation protein DedD